MKTPILVRIAQIVTVLVLLSIARSGVMVLLDQRVSVMEDSSVPVVRFARILTAVAFGIFVMVQTVRRGKYAHIYLLVFLGVALWLSVSAPHTIALLRVLVGGVEAYVPPPGLAFPYESQWS